MLELIAQQGVEPYEGSLRLAEAAHAQEMRRAVVSSSTSCRDVLIAAGIEQLFEEVVDGVVAEREGLAGKPAPDTFIAGARALGAEPAEAAVFEDAQAGVGAGRAGNFGRVMGVDGRAGPRGAAGTGMIGQDVFAVEPWTVPERKLHLELLAQTESIFALSNGRIGLCGNLDATGRLSHF